MTITKIKIHGFRGFKAEGELDFSEPTGLVGSGMTVLTGPNNAGKSSILECLRARSGHQSISFTSGARNPFIDEVSITYTINGIEEQLRSAAKGSSETENRNVDRSFGIFVLPSRRTFNPYFGKHALSRQQYVDNTPLPAQRASVLSNFEGRLFNIQKDPEKFNDLLESALGFRPHWSIDQSDQGQYFLKFFNGKNAHSSDGMGEGVISIFAIIDALYDSTPGNVIVIDEPELSLHPSLQKRVAHLLEKFSADRQIIISTHSPYFVNLRSLANGGGLARITTGEDGTKIFQLSTDTKGMISRLAENNLYNPHVFGLDARELFFQEDQIILTEGQEDVLLYPLIAHQVKTEINGNFFGWGVGGADNIAHLCRILKDLGFTKVAGLLDGDKRDQLKKLCAEFQEYFFACIPAKDIRTKKARKETQEVLGLLDQERNLRNEYRTEIEALFESLNKHLAS